MFLAAWGIAAAHPTPTEAFRAALLALGSLWLGCLALHGFLRLIRFDGDPLLLPLLSLLFLIAGAYHLEPDRLSAGTFAPGSYGKSAVVGLGVLAGVTALGRYFHHINFWLEEKIWWRWVGARPYYASLPFHVSLVVFMIVLGGLLAMGGIRTEGGSLIQVPLPGGLSFTPSELIRLSVAFFLADFLGRNSRVLRNLRTPIGRVWPLNRIFLEPRVELTVVLVTVGLYLVFFYAFKDFGPAAVIIALTLLSLYAATGRMLTSMLLGLGISLAIAIPTWKHLAFHTFANRVAMWISPFDTHFRNGDHLARILWAMASGGWFGMGVGTEGLTSRLPLAQNDAAFAGIVATMGLWTGLAVLAIFAAFAWRGMSAARQAPTDRMRLLAFCLTALLSLQAIWICGAMVRVFPFTGINLPFVSTGMTSMIASALALGTIWNLSRTGSARRDATEASDAVLRTVARLSGVLPALFVPPAIGVILYACPWLLGDRTLQQTAAAVGRDRQRTEFSNPFLERFRRGFPRGRILSSDNRLLAVSHPTPEDFRAIRELAPNLADLAEEQERRGDPDSERRYYPGRASTAHLVGWTSSGRFALQEGSVERDADGFLRGYDPRKLSEYYRNRHNPLTPRPVAQDLQLTVRMDLQRYAETQLRAAMRRAQGAGGALVTYDVESGEVLAAVTLPSVDPNGMTAERLRTYQTENPRTQVLTNKALSRRALYFPGSTFKIVTAAAAIEDEIGGGVICRNGRNATPITWRHQGRSWRRDAGKIADYGKGGHGALRLETDLEQSFTTSCNVFFARMAAELGPERFHAALERAELAEIPDVQDLAEYLPYGGFGQVRVRASPLEMARLAGAAGAARPDQAEPPSARPHGVRALIRREGNRPSPVAPVGVIGAADPRPYRPFSPEAAQTLRALMIQVVQDSSGTAFGAFHKAGAYTLPGITVGGKTGTAEFERPARPGERKEVGRHAWFVGFARSDHEAQPRTIAFAVLLEDVRRGSTGGNSCAPVARDVIARILPIEGQPPPPGFEELERLYPQLLRPARRPLDALREWLRRWRR